MRRRVVDSDLLLRPQGRLRLSALDAGEELVLNVLRQLDADRVVLVAVLVANVARIGPRRGCLGLGRRAVVMRGAVSPGGKERHRWGVLVEKIVIEVGARRQRPERDVGREPGRGFGRNVGWFWG